MTDELPSAALRACAEARPSTDWRELLQRCIIAWDTDDLEFLAAVTTARDALGLKLADEDEDRTDREVLAANGYDIPPPRAEALAPKEKTDEHDQVLARCPVLPPLLEDQQTGRDVLRQPAPAEVAEALAPHPQNGEAMELPDIEVVAAKVHEAWMETKRAQGITSRPAADGTEQMVPYADLPDALQELDRSTVRAVYAAIKASAR